MLLRSKVAFSYNDIVINQWIKKLALFLCYICHIFHRYMFTTSSLCFSIKYFPAMLIAFSFSSQLLPRYTIYLFIVLIIAQIFYSNYVT